MHAAFILTTVTIENVEAFLAYRTAVAEVNAKLGGEMLVRGKVQQVLVGDVASGEVVVAIGFDSTEDAAAYIASDEYGALAPLRRAAGQFVIKLVA